MILCKTKLKKKDNLIFFFFLSWFLFLNPLFFIHWSRNKKVKDKEIKQICFNNIIEILYLLKAFSEHYFFSHDFLCLLMFLTHPSSRVTIPINCRFFSFQTWLTVLTACSDFYFYFIPNSKRCWYIIMIVSNIWKFFTVIWS